MSYSLKSSCSLCEKRNNCLDSAFVQAAISGIHMVNYANGKQTQPHHLGSGTIEIQCWNFEDETSKPAVGLTFDE